MEIIHHKKSMEKNMIDQPKYFKKSNLIQVQNPFDSWVILALGYLGHYVNLGELGPNTPNGLGYTELNHKSSTPHLTPHEVFRLIFTQPFYANNLILRSIFQSGHVDWLKNRETCQSISIFWSKEMLRTIVSSTPSDPLANLFPSCMACPPSPNQRLFTISHKIFGTNSSFHVK